MINIPEVPRVSPQVHPPFTSKMNHYPECRMPRSLDFFFWIILPHVTVSEQYVKSVCLFLKAYKWNCAVHM